MNLNDISFKFASITPKTKWLAALVLYCIVIANVIWSFGPDGPMFSIITLENGKLDFTVSNVYRFWVILVSYVVIIHLIVNAFNGHPRATTFWVCLAALTLLYAYTTFGLCVLAYMLYPFVKRWMSAKFVQAVKSATASESGATTTNDQPPTL